MILVLLAGAIGAAAVYLKPIEAPVRTSGEMVDGLIKLTRARALATTTAHRIRPKSNQVLIVESASSCSALDWLHESRLDLKLPQDVTLSETIWSVCFDSRGMASNNVVLTLNHPQFESRRLEVLLGGMVRWLS